MHLASDPSKRKVLQVVFSPEEYAAFQKYSESTGLTGNRKRSMSELAKDFIVVQLVRQGECCTYAAELAEEAFPPDPRQHKECWGFRCSYCKYQTQCLAGEVPEQTYIPTEMTHHFMWPEASAAARRYKGDEFLRR